MKPEELVIGLKYAKALFEMGVPQKSYFKWQGNEKVDYCVNGGYGLFSWSGCETYAAYTFSELQEFFPQGEYNVERKTIMWTGTEDTNYSMYIMVRKPTKHIVRFDSVGVTLQDCAAYLLATLIRSGDVKIEQQNIPKQNNDQIQTREQRIRDSDSELETIR